MSLAQQTNKLDVLQKRAEMLAEVRKFFEQKSILEVDCNILNAYCNIDDHIDPIKVEYSNRQKGYLHTSPELFLKKCLAREPRDLYFLGHVFRDHEMGDQHRIEFTMIEWYRVSFNYQQMIDETLELIYQFIGCDPVRFYSYFELFSMYTGLDLSQVQDEDLTRYINQHLAPSPPFENEDRADLLNFIFAHQIEPTFTKFPYVVITHFPKELAALSKTIFKSDREEALRFEIYYRGVELANGYEELTGSHNLLKRLKYFNHKRKSNNQDLLPIDSDFVNLNRQLPDCCGVAVGFDRLMMLKYNVQRVKDILIES